jgi:hypothetical protein
MRPNEVAMNELHEKLLNVLATKNFASRFYGLYERLRGNRDAMGTKELGRALSDTGISFAFNTKEKFYRHADVIDGIEVSLGAACIPSGVELLLYLRKDGTIAGGPFHVLAEEVAIRSDPGFSYSPAYPKLPAASAQDLDEIVRFGLTVRQEIEQELAGEPK